MKLTRCDTHFHVGTAPCPWPRCPKGVIDERYVRDIKPSPPVVFCRAKFDDLAEKPRYFWRNEDMPVVLQVPRIVRQDLIRRADWMRPAPIYHYTTTEAFFQIVESQELWLSDHSYLNDASEISHGLELAARAVRELIEADHQDIQIFHDVLTRAESNPPRMCLACFSLQRDSLSQWRAYSGGGCGVALGFGSDELVSGLKYPDDINLARVVYSHRQKRRLMRHFVHFFKMARQVDRQSDKPRWLEPYPNLMWSLLFELAALCKDGGFSDEREVRLLFQESTALREHFGPVVKRFRPAGGVLVPYVSTNDFHRIGLDSDTHRGRLNLFEVVVGPNSKMELVARGVAEYLESKGYQNVRVHKSSIPFR